MNKLNRVGLFLAGGLLLASVSSGIALGLQEQARSPETDKRLEWIAKNAVVVRSIDAADDDFSDLMPLTDSIGAARLVQIGEASHSAGTDFATKVRLIKFLHEKMGFDVLVWESGMYDCREMDTALRSDMPIVDAARLGVFRNLDHGGDSSALRIRAFDLEDGPASADGGIRRAVLL